MILGDTKLSKRVLAKLQKNPQLAYVFVGYLHHLKDLEKYLGRVDVVFITSKETSLSLLDYVERYDTITFKIVPDYLDMLTEPVNFDEFSDIPLLEIKNKSNAVIYRRLKRILDFLLSLFLLFVLSPLFLLLITLIKITSRGPVFIAQKRVGYQELPFTFYKFRTMYFHHASNETVHNDVSYLFKNQRDPRVTFIGGFLRRFCLDELPQLFNVLKGDMSLVGPRPHFAEEMKTLKGVQRKRFSVRPGMTGLWQVSGRHDLSFERTVFLDLYYVKHLSFWLDLQILLKTIPAILFSRGYW